jgi:hypothetical protein
MIASTGAVSSSSVREWSAQRWPKAWIWIILWVTALLTRLAAAFLLPNAELDGYSYAETISRYSASLTTGQFHSTDLFGFWLPLFQFVSAILNAGIGDPLLAGKVVSALCGAVSCVLVFAITEKLTRRPGFAWLAFALIVSNPLHILYSAAAMTDVPFGCLVLASAWFALQDRWIWAAVLAALAESVRLEGWIFVFLLPSLQFFRQRRVSVLLCTILVLPIVSWFLISYAATGEAFAYFGKRARYQANYLDFHPTRRGFDLADIRRDIFYFLIGANQLVSIAVVIAVGVLLVRALRRPDDSLWKPAVVAAYACGLLGLILFAYVTKGQPVLFPRYALFLFALGLPLFAWLLQSCTVNFRPLWLVRLTILVIMAALLQESYRQLPIVTKVLGDFRAQQRVTETLLSELGAVGDSAARCFTDDVAVRVLSHLPRERFLRSGTIPAAAAHDAGAFESYLRGQHVTHLVFFRTEDSLPVTLFPELGQNAGTDTGRFQFVTVAPSDFGPAIWLYRLRDAQ